MAIGGKQSKAMLTDRSSAINEGVAAVWRGKEHRYCLWQICQNTSEQLSQAF